MWARLQVSQKGDSRAIHEGDSEIHHVSDASDTYLDLVFFVRDVALCAVLRRDGVRVRDDDGFDVLLRSRAGARVSVLTVREGASSLIVLIRVISLSLTLRVQPLDLAKDLKYVPACVIALAKSSVFAWKYVHDNTGSLCLSS